MILFKIFKRRRRNVLVFQELREEANIKKPLDRMSRLLMAQSSAMPAEGFVPRIKYYAKGQGEGENFPG